MTTELDPQVTAFFAQMAAAQAQQPPPDPNLTPSEQLAAMRAQFRTMIPLGGAPEPVAHVEDRTIPGPVPIPLRLYKPVDESGLPVLVYYHGGAFTLNGLDTHDTLVRALANRARAIVVSVDYRLAPEHPFPAGLEDAWAALTWAFANAASFGGDATRVAVGGDSSGGTFAAVLAQRARDEGFALVSQLLIYPLVDTALETASWERFGAPGALLSSDVLMPLLDGYLPPAVDRTDPRVSPLRAPDLRGVAPALVVVGSCDPIRDESEAYARKLREANVAADYVEYPGLVHGFAQLCAVLDAGARAVDEVGAALRRTFYRS